MQVENEVYKKIKLIAITLFVIYSQVSFAIELSYKQVSSTEYIWELKNKDTLELQAAQSIIFQGAKEICKDLIPALSKYEFKSFSELASNEKATDLEEFYFLQHVKCAEEIPVSVAEPILELSELQERTLKGSVKNLTLQYLLDKNKAKYSKAYSMLTVNMQELSSFEKWKRRESNFTQQVGNVLHTDVWRMTIYNNPSNSPRPGVYIAADYESEFENSPVSCGFVIWFASNENLETFRVMREEYGNISQEIFFKLTDTDLPKVRQQIGCRPRK